MTESLAIITENAQHLAPRLGAEKWAATYYDKPRKIKNVTPVEDEALAVDFQLVAGAGQWYRSQWSDFNQGTEEGYIISRL